MKCPVCNEVRMREVEKDGILIDVCPDCKGVWLDRGELEKLMSSVRELRTHLEDDYSVNQQYSSQPYYKDSGYSSYKKKKKKTMFDVFGDLFD